MQDKQLFFEKIIVKKSKYQVFGIKQPSLSALLKAILKKPIKGARGKSKKLQLNNILQYNWDKFPKNNAAPVPPLVGNNDDDDDDDDYIPPVRSRIPPPPPPRTHLDLDSSNNATWQFPRTRGQIPFQAHAFRPRPKS